MALKNNKFIKEIEIKLENISPLHIGGKNGELLIDKESNMAYIPGTTMAGAFRAYLKSIHYEQLEKLFGRDNISKVFFYDSYAIIKSLETRPHVKIQAEYGVEENKFERNFIGEGHEFKVKIEIFAEDEENFKNFEKGIYSGIKALNNGAITLGAYKSSGAGLFKVSSLKYSDNNLNIKDELFSYLKRENKLKEQSLEKILNLGFESNEVTFLLDGELETPILIKGEGIMDANRADGEHIKNVNGNYIIPGSSLKGVIRAQGRKILSYLNKTELEEEIFGSKDNKEKIVSKLKCFDSIIKNPMVGKYNKIKIDKFTGGVRKGALMDEDVILGSVTLEGKLNVSEKIIEKQGIALIALIFRDIAVGSLSIGSGYSVGRGRIKGSKLLIKKGDNILYSYEFKNKKLEVDNLKEYFDLLKA